MEIERPISKRYNLHHNFVPHRGADNGNCRIRGVVGSFSRRFGQGPTLDILKITYREILRIFQARQEDIDRL